MSPKASPAPADIPILRVWSAMHDYVLSGHSAEEDLCMLAEQKGLTVAEMLVAISTLGVLLGAAAVGLGTLAPQFDLDNGARQVGMVLSQARIQAITRGHRVVVSIAEEGATVTDDTEHEEIATKSFPPHISISANKPAVFTSVGT